MSEFRHNLTAINSFLRTVIAIAVLGAGSLIGWLGYKAYYADDLALKEAEKQLDGLKTQLVDTRREVTLRDQQIVKLGEDIVAKDQQITKLDTSLRLLKVDHRLAEIEVIDQGVENDEPYSMIRFVELNDNGEPIDEAKTFRLDGDMVYVDYWVVKFDDEYVEQADLERSTSICLFRRIFGEYQQPSEGYSLDKVGVRPKAYGCEGEISEFEQSIWGDFWNIANDPQLAAEKGIRAAHGEAVSTQLRPGKKYRLMLRSSGGLSIAPKQSDDSDDSA